MAILHFTEFQYLETEAKGRDVMVGRLPGRAKDTVDFSGGAAQGQVFGGDTRYVRVWSDVDCYIAVGDDPTATSADEPLTGKVAEYFGVRPGDRLSVLAQ